MNNRTKGSARQPVPDSHATAPDVHTRYQTEKVETALSMEFSCLRYENGRTNTVSRSTTNLQRSTWARHEKRPDHLMSAVRWWPNTPQQTIQLATERAITDLCKESQLPVRTMYMVTKNNLLMFIFNEILKLQQLSGCTSEMGKEDDTSKFYTSRPPQTDMLNTVDELRHPSRHPLDVTTRPHHRQDNWRINLQKAACASTSSACETTTQWSTS